MREVILMFIFSLLLYVEAEYRPEMFMPFRKIPGTSDDVSIFENTITCNTTKQTLRECSDECFKMKHLRQNCVGFLTINGTTCDLCETTGAGDHTSITPGHTFYLLQGEALKPNIHIDMEGIDLGTETITGFGVSGTIFGVGSDDVFQGIKGTSLRFSNTERLMLQVPQPECFCSSDYCNGKITLSFWIAPFSSHLQHIVAPENPDNTGLTCATGNYIIDCAFRSPGKQLRNIQTSSTLSSVWHHIAVAVDLTTGASIYLDGVLDGFKDISQVESHLDTNYPSCSTVYFGMKNAAGQSPANANIDEFKYFYDALGPTGNFAAQLYSVMNIKKLSQESTWLHKILYNFI